MTSMRRFASWWYLIPVLFAAMMFYGCGGTGDDPISAVTTQGHVTGQVTLAGIASLREVDPSIMALTTGAGLASAEVWLENYRTQYRAFTTSSGSFDITPAPFGSHRVVASFTNPTTGKVYKWRSSPVTISQSSPTNGTGNIGVQLATGTVSGVLLDKSGAPVANATISIWGETITTTSTGSFSLPYPMPPVSEGLTVTATGFQTTTIPVNFAAPPTFIQTTLAPTGDTNRAPMLELKASQYSGVSNSGYVNLTASATDPDANTLTITWMKDYGTISTSTTDAYATWQAPPSGAGTATIVCTASDSTLGASVKVYIGYGSGLATGTNHPPTVFGIISSVATVTKNYPLPLTASATDVDAGDTLSYSWMATGGTFNATNTQSVVWTSPDVAATSSVTITVTVKDASGASGSTSKAIIVTPGATGTNTPPTASITAPVYNELFNPYSVTLTPIIISGAGYDLVGGATTSLSLAVAKPEWYVLPPGSSTPFLAASGTWSAYGTPNNPGTYAVSLWVTDAEGARGGATLTFRVNGPATLYMAPTTSYYYASAPVTLVGNVVWDEDIDDGVLAANHYNWYIDWSSTSTPLFNGPSTSTRSIPQGTHTVMLTYTDRLGLVGSVTRPIFIDMPPVVTIASPALPNQVYMTGANLTLVATSADFEQGSLPNGSYAWYDNTGTGQFQITGQTNPTLTQVFSPGSHSITVVGIDSYSASSTATTSFYVNRPPTLSYTVAASQTVFTFGATFTVTATAAEPDGQPLSIGWSNNGGASYFASATAQTISCTIAGTSTLTIVATDSLGASTTAQFTYLVNRPPVLSIASPSSSGQVYPYGSNLTVVANATDLEQGSLPAGSFQWFDNTGTGTFQIPGQTNSTLTMAFSPGSHSLMVGGIDVYGASGTATTSFFMNRSPLLSYSVIPSSTTFAYGATFTVVASATEPDGQPLSIGFWKTPGNTFVASATAATFTYTTTGAQTVTIIASDTLGASTTVQFDFTIAGNSTPTMTIATPTNNAWVFQYAQFTISGYGTDPEDGPVATSTLTWMDNGVSIPAGVGTSTFDHSISALGTHVICLNGKDSALAVGSTSHYLFVNATPTCYIGANPATSTSPDVGRFDTGMPITLGGTGLDQTGDTLIHSWFSSIDGSVATGSTTTYASPSAGYHQITYRVTDNHGVASQATRTILVNRLATLSLTITPDYSAAQFATTTASIPVYLISPPPTPSPTGNQVDLAVTVTDHEDQGNVDPASIGFWLKGPSDPQFIQIGSGTAINNGVWTHPFPGPGSYTVRIDYHDSHGSLAQIFKTFHLWYWQTYSVTNPISLAIAGGRLWVAAAGSTSVTGYNSTTLASENTWGGVGTLSTTVLDLAAGPSNTLYVHDVPGTIFQLGNVNGVASYVSQWTSGALGGIGANTTNVFVANNTVQTLGQFDLSGGASNSAYIIGLASPTGFALNNTEYYIAQDNGTNGFISRYNLQAIDNAWFTAGTLSYGFGSLLALEADGNNLYVADPANNRVVVVYKVNTGEKVLVSFGASGGGIGEFATPRGITADGTYLFIADYGNDRIVRINAGDSSWSQ
ncbi:MAG: hypothetical protein GX442_15540 [Candidatus Riflebacteria bacterium]|nr:hypothetical protein [Candidatus Riflebacteria bacterium]